MANIVGPSESTDPGHVISRTTVWVPEPAAEHLRLRILKVQWSLNCLDVPHARHLDTHGISRYLNRLTEVNLSSLYSPQICVSLHINC